MTFIKHVILFVQQDLKKLRRKWLSLPLLLLFPIAIVGITAFVIISFISPEENEPIQVGLVDHDQSKETRLVVNLIEESSQLGNYITIKPLTEEKAIKQIKQDKLSAYITFPDGFTNDLYNGNSVDLPITGNPNKRTNSLIVKELLDSVARHIQAAQANILTINYFAKQMPINKETRNDILFDQFTSFVLYTIGKDKMLSEETVTNNAISTPVHYYGLASWFIILTIWLIVFYSFLTENNQLRMKYRMRLYGVFELQQILAKMIITLVSSFILAIIVFLLFQHIAELTLYWEDYQRIFTIALLYSVVFLEGMAIIEIVFHEQRLRLLCQSLFTIITILASGAIIPTLYFPMYIQSLLPYSFATQGYHWLEEIILNGRFYADFVPLTLFTGTGLFLFIGISIWKERVQQ